MQKKWSLILSVFLFALACGPLGSGEIPATTTPSSGKGRCGDGVCDGPENAQICPQDCVTEAVTDGEATPSPGGTPPAGYVTFSINVHDFVHVDDSADTVLRLIDLFEAYGARGDFYLTAPMVHYYAEQRPDVLERLRASDMTISFHIRPPHPLYAGFDQRFDGLDEATLTATIRDYETYRLDMATGDLLRDQPGGYSYVTDVFERPLVVVAGFSAGWQDAALPVFADLGAQMAVTYHETGTDLEEPFERQDGLLVRPSDFSITRWATPERPEEMFWWNMLDTEYADQYVPVIRLQQELAAWHADRPPFITVLIHENNFFRQFATPWALVYYTDREKTQPRTPPFDLDTPDSSKSRTVENQEAIWAAYEEIVAYAVAHLEVVTSEDIVRLATDGSR